MQFNILAKKKNPLHLSFSVCFLSSDTRCKQKQVDQEQKTDSVEVLCCWITFSFFLFLKYVEKTDKRECKC